MRSTTSLAAIEKLRELFSAYGLPEELVSDNGPQFTSSEFAEFLELNGIRHTRSPPYHPSTNGATERMVQVLKKALKSVSGSSIKHKLAKFLFSYRNTPHTLTGETPAKLFLNRQPRTRLSLLEPNLADVVEAKQEKQKFQHDGKLPLCEFIPGDSVYIRNFRGGSKWNPGVIQALLGPVKPENVTPDEGQAKVRPSRPSRTIKKPERLIENFWLNPVYV